MLQTFIERRIKIQRNLGAGDNKKIRDCISEARQMIARDDARIEDYLTHTLEPLIAGMERVIEEEMKGHAPGLPVKLRSGGQPIGPGSKRWKGGP